MFVVRKLKDDLVHLHGQEEVPLIQTVQNNTVISCLRLQIVSGLNKLHSQTV